MDVQTHLYTLKLLALFNLFELMDIYDLHLDNLNK